MTDKFEKWLEDVLLSHTNNMGMYLNGISAHLAGNTDTILKNYRRLKAEKLEPEKTCEGERENMTDQKMSFDNPNKYEEKLLPCPDSEKKYSRGDMIDFAKTYHYYGFENPDGIEAVLDIYEKRLRGGK